MNGRAANLAATAKHLRRHDDRIIIHFDYDCFYASVFEAENPTLRSLPLAVQQKQIIVTCNYEARRRGLRKLQLITEAKSVCPDAIIVLGEDLTRFRDASKSLYDYLRAFSWSNKVEKLGFDEVWLDVSDIVDYNLELLNDNDLFHSFFCLSKTDPTQGFPFDATVVAGHAYPSSTNIDTLLHSEHDRRLTLRLLLGSHLAMHIRLSLEEQRGYTSTVGIGTSKLISKLVGNLHKPKGQTTILPPYGSGSGQGGENTINTFLDAHDIGKIPYIGFKLAQILRENILGRAPDFARGLVYGGTRENVTVGQVRLLPDLGPDMLEKLLAAPGMPHGVGLRVYQLVNGIDNTEVGIARNVPKQLSIEDSYIRLDTMEQVMKELIALTTKLISRMHTDLVDGDEWLAKPATLRLTTRPRPALNSDGTRNRNFSRISRSAPTPSYLFTSDESFDALASRVVSEHLLPLFNKLHPEKSGWNLSLVNVAVTNMTERVEVGSDIGSIFKKQQENRLEWETHVLPFVDDYQTLPVGPREAEPEPTETPLAEGGAFSMTQTTSIANEDWDMDEEDEDENVDLGYVCPSCQVMVPSFAQAAHARFHEVG